MRRPTLEEREVRRLLDDLAAEIGVPTDEELVLAAKAAATGDREHVLQLDGRRGAPARRPGRPARWALALAATVGLALLGGIGLGRQLAPAAESAEPPVLPSSAPAFLHAAGWHVETDGIDVPPGTRAAVAATVPLDTGGAPLDLAPAAVLAALPPSGIVVAVAGVPAQRRAAASAPLRVADAAVSTRWHGREGGERALAEYALRHVAGGLDLDVRVVFGSAEPSRAQLAEAQAQLDRLVVRTAASQVTLAARPTLVRWAEPVALSGAVAGAGAGERVTIEVKECQRDYWRVVDMAATTSGGQWFSETSMQIGGLIRARTATATSAPVAIAARPGVILTLDRARPRASVVGIRSLYGKQVVLERFDRGRQRWVVAARTRITESDGAGDFIWNQAYFSPRVLTRGMLYRAVIANAQTGPCYLAGYSNMVRR